MDYDVFSPLTLCKQKQRKILNKRNSRRRALTNVRRVLLDTTHAELSTVSSNHLDTQDENNLNIISNHLDSDYLYKNDVHSYELQNIHSSTDTVSFPFDEQASDDTIDISNNEQASDDTIDISNNEQASDNLYECFNLSNDFTLPDIYLHSSTNLKKAEFCRNLLTLFRDAKVCKSHCDRFIQLIYSGLPVPNNMPRSMKNLLNEMQVEELFVKRSICVACYQDLNNHNDKFNCTSTDERFHADIYDIDTYKVFSQLIDRLFVEITDYKQQIASQSCNEHNDIPFNNLYRNMMRRFDNDTNFVSILLHIDGISLCKSSKLTLWLLSGVFVELPPHLRYRRSNMILLSMWIGYGEPIPNAWLPKCFDCAAEKWI
ncbi:unnamed protein product, partial [Rotaria magnacalcarata]